MANDPAGDARPASRRGRHRVPGARPPWLAMAGVMFTIVVVIAVLWLVLGLVTGLRGTDAQSPGSAANASSPDTPGPTTGATTDATTPAGTSTPVLWNADAAARRMLVAFEKQHAAAAEGALVLVGKFGQNVDNSPVVVTGEWGTGRLRNGLTVAENHEKALRAGKLTARKALPAATTVAKVAVTRTDVRSLPVRSARETFGALTGSAGGAETGCAACQDIIVTGVTSSTMKVATTVGAVVVPAWSFEVQGTKARIVAPGLAPTALLDPAPAYRGAVATELAAAQLPLWSTALSDDGYVFTAFVDTDEVRRRGGCWRLFAKEAADAVAVYAAPGTGESTAPCADDTGQVSVRMAAPLGERTLLDTYWARAIAP